MTDPIDFSEVPSGVPDPWNTIPGYQEVHNASDRTTCHAMNKKFQQQGLRLSLYDILDINATGRLNAPRRRGKRVSSSRGRMYLCIFRGPDAVEDRYGLNDDYEAAGLPVPNSYNYPNDYRQLPDPLDRQLPYTQDSDRGTPPDPDAEPPF